MYEGFEGPVALEQPYPRSDFLSDLMALLGRSAHRGLAYCIGGKHGVYWTVHMNRERERTREDKDEITRLRPLSGPRDGYDYM